MIIVTGTGRSGTSMWMQAFNQAGFVVVGEAFPGNWEERFGEANPGGYFESTLVDGIHFGSNPNPRTGARLVPEESRDFVVKIFAPGLRRTERIYIDHVLASVRHWSSFRRSTFAMYDLLIADRGGSPKGLMPLVPPVLKWWGDHYAILDDAQRRGYPLRLVSFEATRAEPLRVMQELMDWLGVTAELDAAAASVKPSLSRTGDALPADLGQASEPVDGVPPDCLGVMDELWLRIHEGRSMDPAFRRRLDEVDQALKPLLDELEEGQKRYRWRSRRG